MATWYSKMIDIEGGQVSVKETHYSVKKVHVSIKEKIVIYKEIKSAAHDTEYAVEVVRD